MTSQNLSIVLAGGGTAGHISPLLAIAAALRSAAPSPRSRLLAVGTPAGMETRLVPAAGVELATIDRVPFPRKPSLDLLKLPAGLPGRCGSQAASWTRPQADVLVGVGGYVCTPLYLAARRRGIPIVIHEANTRPGLANRVGSVPDPSRGHRLRHHPPAARPPCRHAHADRNLQPGQGLRPCRRARSAGPGCRASPR